MDSAFVSMEYGSSVAQPQTVLVLVYYVVLVVRVLVAVGMWRWVLDDKDQIKINQRS